MVVVTTNITLLLVLVVIFGIGNFVTLILMTTIIKFTRKVSTRTILRSVRGNVNDALNKLTVVLNFKTVLNGLVSSANTTRHVTAALVTAFNGGHIR